MPSRRDSKGSNSCLWDILIHRRDAAAMKSQSIPGLVVVKHYVSPGNLRSMRKLPLQWHLTKSLSPEVVTLTSTSGWSAGRARHGTTAC